MDLIEIDPQSITRIAGFARSYDLTASQRLCDFLIQMSPDDEAAEPVQITFGYCLGIMMLEAIAETLSENPEQLEALPVQMLDDIFATPLAFTLMHLLDREIINKVPLSVASGEALDKFLTYASYFSSELKKEEQGEPTFVAYEETFDQIFSTSPVGLLAVIAAAAPRPNNISADEINAFSSLALRFASEDHPLAEIIALQLFKILDRSELAGQVDLHKIKNRRPNLH